MTNWEDLSTYDKALERAKYHVGRAGSRNASSDMVTAHAKAALAALALAKELRS